MVTDLKVFERTVQITKIGYINFFASFLLYKSTRKYRSELVKRYNLYPKLVFLSSICRFYLSKNRILETGC